MSLYNGSDKIKDLYIGSTKIKELYVGSTKVYSSAQELPWTQPILSANGTIGGSAFACAASSNQSTAYKAFDGNSSGSLGYQWSSSSYPAWVEWYNPTPLKTTNIKINSGANGFPQGNVGDFYIQVSEDNVNWTTIYTGANRTSGVSLNTSIDFSLANGYKYWRLYCLNYTFAGNVYTNASVCINLITITATQIV